MIVCYESQASCDAFESVNRVVAVSIVARCLAWLQSSDLKEWVQDKLADISCRGENLFGKSMEDKAEELEREQLTMNCLSRKTADLPRSSQQGKRHSTRVSVDITWDILPTRPTKALNWYSKKAKDYAAKTLKSFSLLCSHSQEEFFDSFLRSMVHLPLPRGVPQQVGRRLVHFAHRWPVITTDSWVLKIIQSEYLLQFAQLLPSPFFSGEYPLNPQHHDCLWLESHTLLVNFAIKLVPLAQAGK